MSGYFPYTTCRRIASLLKSAVIPKYDVGDVLNPSFADELHKVLPSSPSGAYINDILWLSFKKGGVAGLEAELLKHIPDVKITEPVVDNPYEQKGVDKK